MNLQSDQDFRGWLARPRPSCRALNRGGMGPQPGCELGVSRRFGARSQQANVIFSPVEEFMVIASCSHKNAFRCLQSIKEEGGYIAHANFYALHLQGLESAAMFAWLH